MTEISEKILNKKVVGIYNNFIEQTLELSFEDNCIIKFNQCAIVFDLGIVGHTVSFISFNGTLGIALELKKMKLNPEEYNYLLISRDIEDYENKNELLISYKKLEVIKIENS